MGTVARIAKSRVANTRLPDLQGPPELLIKSSGGFMPIEGTREAIPKVVREGLSNGFHYDDMNCCIIMTRAERPLRG